MFSAVLSPVHYVILSVALIALVALVTVVVVRIVRAVKRAALRERPAEDA